MSYAPAITSDSSMNGAHYSTTALGGGRVIAADADGSPKYASSANIPDSFQILGINVGAVSSNQVLTIQRTGILIDSSWTWTIGSPIYLGLNGILTQTLPAYPNNHFSLIVAFPITATKIFINIKEPILLGV